MNAYQPFTAAPEVASHREVPVQNQSGISFVRWTYGLINRLVLTSDVCILGVSALLAPALPLAFFANQLPEMQLVLVTAMQMAVFFAVMTWTGAYRVERYTHIGMAAAYLLGAMLTTTLVLYFFLMAFSPATIGYPAYLVAWSGLALVLLLASRLVQRVLVRKAHQGEALRRRVVIIGANDIAARFARDLKKARYGETYDVVAVFRDPSDHSLSAEIGGMPIIGDLRALGLYGQHNTIDILVLALPWSRATELFRLTEAVSGIAADIVVPMDEESVNPGFAPAISMGGAKALRLMSRPLKGSQSVVKVIEDYVIASVALVLLSPLMLLTALLIRLEGPGPIFFLQSRPGFGTKPFNIYKFRTMHVDPEDDATIGTTGPRDARVTRVGAWLRRLSIDELPQLINVLRGEMSIVGPRPYVENMLVGNERFSVLARQYAERHRIKPGLTGYAQANGMRSYALRSKDNARRSIEMDVHYMRNWSLWLDMRIIVRTAVVGLAGRHVF